MSNIRTKMLRAVKSNCHGEADKAIANIEIYLTNPSGIGEHSDVIEAVIIELDKLCQAQERIDTLEKFFE